MKLFTFFPILYFFLLLPSCVEPLELVEPDDGPEREIFFFTQYEGVAVMVDSTGVELGSSDQPERDEFIDIRWSMGEHLYFVSEKFEFDIDDCTIWGGDFCEKYVSNVKEDNEAKGKHWIYFEPADGFWECMERDNYHPGDEIFHFHLMAREKG